MKTDAPASISRVAEQQKHYVEIQRYSSTALKSYFDQDALMLPVETLIEKSQERDYQFFLQQDNFLKIVDTLEKFE